MEGTGCSCESVGGQGWWGGGGGSSGSNTGKTPRGEMDPEEQGEDLSVSTCITM